MEQVRKINHIRFGEVRVVEKNNSINFVLDDIACSLGFSMPRMAVKMYCKNAVEFTLDASTGWEEVTLIPESDVYRLALHAGSSEAKRFQDWIYACIHPSLFQTEEQLSIQAVEKILSDPDTIIRLASELKTEQQKRKEEEQANRSNFPKVLFASTVEASRRSILIGELATILRQRGVRIGQNRLFQWLRNNGYLCKSGERYNCPTQRSMDMKLFEIKKTTVAKPDGTLLVATTPKITGKGQIYFIQKFLQPS